MFNVQSDETLAIPYLCKNLTPKIRKLAIWGQSMTEKDIEILTKRCNGLTSLYIYQYNLTNEALTFIIQNLSHTLKELGFQSSIWFITEPMEKFLEFQSMIKLTHLSLEWHFGTSTWINSVTESELRIFFEEHFPNLKVIYDLEFEEIYRFRISRF